MYPLSSNFRAAPDLIHLYKRILTKFLKRTINYTFSNKAELFSANNIKRLFPDLNEKFFKSNDCSRLSDTKPLKLLSAKRFIELK